MKNKKNFNNLYDSVLETLLLVICLACYLISIYGGVLQNEIKNKIIMFIFGSIFFGVPVIIISIWIINYCYEYWFLDDEEIHSKRLFRRKVSIKLSEIEVVEKKEVVAIILGSYKSNAYIIHSDDKKITVLIREKKQYYDLENALSMFLT